MMIFQNNPFLLQLKYQLCSKVFYVKGIVRITNKGFGFLDVSKNTSYVISVLEMKKVMHGDKILASVIIKNNQKIAKPEKLIEPFLKYFVGKIKRKNDGKEIYVRPEYPYMKHDVVCINSNFSIHKFLENDWVIAKILNHPLQGYSNFQAEIVQYITYEKDPLAFWLAMLNRHQIDYTFPKVKSCVIEMDNFLKYQDFTNLPFITIDHANTEDMDDALYIEKKNNGKLSLFVAVADPTAYIPIDSKLDMIAKNRGYSSYFPGLKVPMLPRELSDNLCSLKPNVRRPALVCQFIILENGDLSKEINFVLAWIESKKKLSYENVSNWLENLGQWNPKDEIVKKQIFLLYEMYKKRFHWRKKNALVLNYPPSYRFIFDGNSNILNVIIEKRRIANYIVEEAMIAANLCATRLLKEKLGFGIFNVHSGFNPKKISKIIQILRKNNIEVKQESLLTLKGFCSLWKILGSKSIEFLDMQIRRFHSFSRIHTTPSAHYILGFDSYATWTSPIRKYTDMVNHRLLKSIINNSKNEVRRPDDLLIKKIHKCKRINRLALRDINNWLYFRFLKRFIRTQTTFSTKILEVNYKGFYIQFVENGAVIFVPEYFFRLDYSKVRFDQELGIVKIRKNILFKLNDFINIRIKEIQIKNFYIIARIILLDFQE